MIRVENESKGKLDFKEQKHDEAKAGKRSSSVLLDTMSEVELYVLREQIDQRLPSSRLADMNLEEELVLQYNVAKALQTDVMDSDEESNKKATVLNATANTLASLV